MKTVIKILNVLKLNEKIIQSLNFLKQLFIHLQIKKHPIFNWDIGQRAQNIQFNFPPVILSLGFNDASTFQHHLGILTTRLLLRFASHYMRYQ